MTEQVLIAAARRAELSGRQQWVYLSRSCRFRIATYFRPSMGVLLARVCGLDDIFVEEQVS